MIGRRASRRALLGGGVAAATTAIFGGAIATAADASPQGQGRPGGPGGGPGRPGGGPASLIGFTEVPVSTADAVVVPPGYIAEVLIPWGTPLRGSGPAWRPDATNSAADQAKQVGMHHDGIHYFPLGRGHDASRRGLLVVNHEYVDQVLLYPDGDAPMTPEKVAKALAGHGVTVVEVAVER
nr:DUF839 domain-containing protein [Micromonospora sp. DSM 115978]